MCSFDCSPENQQERVVPCVHVGGMYGKSNSTLADKQLIHVAKCDTVLQCFV